MKELKKGNKAPYRGYLLNIGEYEDYKIEREALYELKREIDSLKKDYQ